MKVKTIQSFFPGITQYIQLSSKILQKINFIFKFLNCYCHVEDAENHIFHTEMILSERVFDTRRMPYSERVNVLGNRILWKFKYGNNISVLFPISLTWTNSYKYILVLFLFSTKRYKKKFSRNFQIKTQKKKKNERTDI